MPNRPPSRTQIQSMLRGPNVPATVASTATTTMRNGVQITTGTTPVEKQNIGELITHIAKSDNHLWQALNSLQQQANSLAGQNSNWTSWVPQFSDPAITQQLTTTNTSAYYMTVGAILNIAIRTDVVLGLNDVMEISLPVDVGELIVKTCAAFLVEVGLSSSLYSGVLNVEIVNQTALLKLSSFFRSMNCTLTMGGAIAIL